MTQHRGLQVVAWMERGPAAPPPIARVQVIRSHAPLPPVARVWQGTHKRHQRYSIQQLYEGYQVLN